MLIIRFTYFNDWLRKEFYFYNLFSYVLNVLNKAKKDLRIYEFSYVLMVYVNAKYSLLKAILMQLLKGQLKIFFFLLKVDLPHHVVLHKIAEKIIIQQK